MSQIFKDSFQQATSPEIPNLLDILNSYYEKIPDHQKGSFNTLKNRFYNQPNNFELEEWKSQFLTLINGLKFEISMEKKKKGMENQKKRINVTFVFKIFISISFSFAFIGGIAWILIYPSCKKITVTFKIHDKKTDSICKQGVKLILKELKNGDGERIITIGTDGILNVPDIELKESKKFEIHYWLSDSKSILISAVNLNDVNINNCSITRDEYVDFPDVYYNNGKKTSNEKKQEGNNAPTSINKSEEKPKVFKEDTNPFRSIIITTKNGNETNYIFQVNGEDISRFDASSGIKSCTLKIDTSVKKIVCIGGNGKQDTIKLGKENSYSIN